MPSTRARPSDRKSNLPTRSLPYSRPGCRNASPLPDCSAAAPSRSERLKPNWASTKIVINKRADHQQHGLDDLHPGGALHAAEGHVDDHQDADADDHQVLQHRAVDPRAAGRPGCRRRPSGPAGRRSTPRWSSVAAARADRGLPHPVRQLVGHRVAAGVAQQLGDQQQRDQPGDQEPDGVEEAVVAVERDRAGDAEERRGRHVVAADRQAVLEAGEGAAAGVVVGGGLVLPGRPEGDAQGQGDDDQEQADGQEAIAPVASGMIVIIGRSSRLELARGAWWPADPGSCRRAGSRGRRSRTSTTNCSSPKTRATLMLPIDLRVHEVAGPVVADDVGDVPDHEGDGRREREASDSDDVARRIRARWRCRRRHVLHRCLRSGLTRPRDGRLNHRFDLLTDASSRPAGGRQSCRP